MTSCVEVSAVWHGSTAGVLCVTCGERHLYHNLAIDQLFGQLMRLQSLRGAAP